METHSQRDEKNEVDELSASQNPSNDDNIHEDAIARVLGRDKRGQVKGLGYEATPSQVDAQFQSRQKLLNRCGVENVAASYVCTSSHAYTPQSQHWSAHLTQGSAQLENVRCQLLHLYPENNVENQVVTERRISSTDPKALVHHMPLGRSYRKVWIDVVEEDIKVYRPIDEYENLNEAMGTTVAWLKNYIKLL